MSSSQSTTDLDAQIAKLEEKLNALLDKVQEAQKTNLPSQEAAPEPTLQNQEYIPATTQEQTSSVSAKSRQEILAEYEKGYLARLEENAIAQEEIRRAAEELEAKNNATQPNSTRGSLPKGF
jgi:hypothetical protein